jgi:hypothetical protein
MSRVSSPYKQIAVSRDQAGFCLRWRRACPEAEYDSEYHAMAQVSIMSLLSEPGREEKEEGWCSCESCPNGGKAVCGSNA